MLASSRRVCSSSLTSSQYLTRMIPEFDDRFLHRRRDLEKALHLVHRAEFHDALDASAVVPAAVKDHDFARGRQMPHIALNVHLRLLALGRRRQRDDAIDAWADPLGDRLDDPALAGAVAAFEHDHDLQSLGDDPELQLDQLSVQTCEFALVVLAAKPVLGFRGLLVLGLPGLVRTFCHSHFVLPVTFTSCTRVPMKDRGLGTGMWRLEGVGFAVRAVLCTKRLTRSEISVPAVQKTRYG